MKITISGAGITGCVAAMLLADEGHEVEVYEAVPQLAELGVGLNLLPHAVAVLDRLGLADRLEATGVATRELVYYNRHGQRIWGEPRGRFAGYPVPQISMHRGKLQMVLLHALEERIGKDRIHTGRRLVAAEAGAPARATFEALDGTIPPCAASAIPTKACRATAGAFCGGR
jgi:5-methylphenazine-1-carboxylate 1-monooxygenase